LGKIGRKKMEKNGEKWRKNAKKREKKRKIEKNGYGISEKLS